MEKPEIVIGDFKVRKIDAMNWQVFERRELKAGRADVKSREGEIERLDAKFAKMLDAAVEKAVS